MNRLLNGCFAAALALLASACATTQSDQGVSTIVTHETATPAAPIDNLGVATLHDTFAAGSPGSKSSQISAAEANDEVRTLFPALLAAIPRVFSEGGVRTTPIATEHVAGDAIVAAMARYDYVLVVSPRSSSGRRGGAPTHMVLDAQIYDRHHVSAWRGDIVLSTERVASSDSPIYRWDGAMADDAAHALLAHLSKQGLVKTGPAVPQSIDMSGFQGAERGALLPPTPAAPEPDVPAALAAVQIHSPAGADVHLFETTDQIRSALPGAPAPQITVGRLQTLWDQKDGIIVRLADGVATSIAYDPRSKASIPALDLALGAGIKDFEAKLGAGRPEGPRSLVWPLDARRELVARYGDNGKVGGLELRVRSKPRSR